MNRSRLLLLGLVLTCVLFPSAQSRSRSSSSSFSTRRSSRSSSSSSSGWFRRSSDSTPAYRSQWSTWSFSSNGRSRYSYDGRPDSFTKRWQTYRPRSYATPGDDGPSSGAAFQSLTAGQPITRRVLLPNKSVGLGIAAAFISGNAANYVGDAAFEGVIYRYQTYQKLKRQHQRAQGGNTTTSMDNRITLGNYCQPKCPWGTECKLGIICVCKDVCFTGYPSGHGFLSGWITPLQEANMRCPPEPECFVCDGLVPCYWNELNLVCVREPGTPNLSYMPGKCQCRGNTRWNPQAKKCQLHLDADCSSFPADSTPSPALVAAVKRINPSRSAVANRTLNVKDTRKTRLLAHSILNKISIEGLAETELLEAYCRDVESFLADLELVDFRPVKCPRVPRTACASVFDSHDCSGGWSWDVDEGDFNFAYFSRYWSYRNDIDTIGVRAGCTLDIFAHTDFKGTSKRLQAASTDEWWVLEEIDDYFTNNIESMKCHCDKKNVTDLFN